MSYNKSLQPNIMISLLSQDVLKDMHLKVIKIFVDLLLDNLRDFALLLKYTCYTNLRGDTALVLPFFCKLTF